MKTQPDISFEEHMPHCLEFQRKHFAELTEAILLFYDEEDITLSAMAANLEKRKLMKMREFKLLFERLCSEGREWINLGGDSWYGKSYIVSVEYSKRLGFSVTAIIHSGPTLGRGGTPLAETQLKIIE